MEVKFYNNSSPSTKISKELGTAVLTTTCEIMGQVDVVNPTIIVKGPVPSNVNYMVIGAPLNRAYFITAMDYTIAKTTIIAGHSDVISNCKTLLKETTLNYVRGAGDLTEMADSSYPISDYLIQQYFPLDNWTDIFSNKASGRQFLFRTIRGQANVYPRIDGLDGMVVWAGGFTWDDSTEPETLYYDCYQLKKVGQKTLTSIYNKRQDITGIQQIEQGDYVVIGGLMWQLKDLPDREAGSLKFNYIGDTGEPQPEPEQPEQPEP